MSIAKKIRSDKNQPQYNRIILAPMVGRSDNLELVLTENNTRATNTLLKDDTVDALNQKLNGRMNYGV
jgi:hypothetical protein